MLFLRQEHLLPKLSQKSHVNCNVSGTVLLKIHVNICTFQSNKSILKKRRYSSIVRFNFLQYAITLLRT
jgi:hypothetical protein